MGGDGGGCSGGDGVVGGDGGGCGGDVGGDGCDDDDVTLQGAWMSSLHASVIWQRENRTKSTAS